MFSSILHLFSQIKSSYGNTFQPYRLGYSKRLLPFNYSKFEVLVRRSPWLSIFSYRNLMRRARFGRSSTFLSHILSSCRSFVFIEGLGHKSIFWVNLHCFRYWHRPMYEVGYLMKTILTFSLQLFCAS